MTSYRLFCVLGISYLGLETKPPSLISLVTPKPFLRGGSRIPPALHKGRPRSCPALRVPPRRNPMEICRPSRGTCSLLPDRTWENTRGLPWPAVGCQMAHRTSYKTLYCRISTTRSSHWNTQTTLLFTAPTKSRRYTCHPTNRRERRYRIPTGSPGLSPGPRERLTSTRTGSLGCVRPWGGDMSISLGRWRKPKKNCVTSSTPDRSCKGSPDWLTLTLLRGRGAIATGPTRLRHARLHIGSMWRTTPCQQTTCLWSSRGSKKLGSNDSMP